jgi:hypothetical protein
MPTGRSIELELSTLINLTADVNAAAALRTIAEAVDNLAKYVHEHIEHAPRHVETTEELLDRHAH